MYIPVKYIQHIQSKHQQHKHVRASSSSSAFTNLSFSESQLQPRAATAPSSAPTWRVRSATSEDALCFRDESEPQPAGSPVGDAANYGGRNLMRVAWVLSKMGNCDFLILT